MQTLTFRILLMMVAVLMIWQGCQISTAGSVPEPQDDEPLHLHMICPAGNESATVACTDVERLSAFNGWIREALSKPHSTFTIWSVGSHRQHYDAYFSVCIPPSWGADVMRKKGLFVKTARAWAIGQRTASGMGSALPQTCTPPGPLITGVHRVTTAIPTTRPGLWTTITSNSAAGRPLHTVVVCDRSNSTLGVGCDSENLLSAFDLWIAEGFTATGGSFTVYQVGSSRDTARLLYTVSVPDRTVAEKVAFLIAARAELDHLLSEGAEKNTSAVAETISVAISQVRERSGRYQLLILSDLRQFTPRKWNFERSVPPIQEFNSWLKQQKLSVDLRDVPVPACGLHSQSGPGAGPLNGQLAARIRDVWDATFKAMGAEEVKLFSSCQAAFAAH